MNPTIEKIVNLLFEDLEETEEVRALRDEVMQNCQERFSDLVEGGMTADEATSAVVESLKGMEEMLREYPRKRSEEPADEGEECSSYVFSPDSVRRIETQLVSENVTCQLSPDGLVHVEADGTVRVALQDGVLRIRHVERRHVGASFKLSFFNFNFSFSTDEVKLLLPERLLADVCLRTTSGDVEWSGAGVEKLSIATASGDVTVSDARMAGEMQVQTASGDVEMLHSAASQLDVTTASGDITLSQLDIAQHARASTASGDVHWNASCPDVQVGSISGDVTVKGECARIQCKTTSGDARIEAESCLERITGQTTSGDARIRLAAGTQAFLNCRSRFGDVRQRVESYPNAAVIVEWSATSGDVTVE